MNLAEILSMLEKSSMAVFTINDFRKVSGLEREVCYVYLNRMARKGLVHKIEKGRFTIYNDPFLVSTQMVYPSYISFLSALYLHGKTTQTINEITVATSKRKSGRAIFGMKVRFVRLEPGFMFGFRKTEKGGSYIFLAELEKAIIDSLYLPRYCALSEVFEALRDADIEKLLAYSSRIETEAVNRRLGYMLGLLGAKTAIAPKTKAVYKLNPAIKSSGRFDPKWRVYVNEVLE